MIARLIIKLTIKKWGGSINTCNANQHIKQSWTSDFHLIFNPILIVDKRSLLLYDLPLCKLTFRFFLLSILIHLWFFLSSIYQKIFITNYPDFYILITSFLEGWKFFINRSTAFSSLSSTRILEVFLPNI